MNPQDANVFYKALCWIRHANVMRNLIGNKGQASAQRPCAIGKTIPGLHLIVAALWHDSLELMGNDGCASAAYAIRFRIDNLVNRRQKRGETVAFFLAYLSRMAKRMASLLDSPEILK
jgi:hypothetical protein